MYILCSTLYYIGWGVRLGGKCIEARGKLSYWIYSLLQRINSIKKRRNEIASMHITVPLAMFCLDTMTLNYDICERAQNLKDRLIRFQVDVNRDTNTRYYCFMQRNSNDNWHEWENGKVDRTCTFQQRPDWTSSSRYFCPKWRLQGIRFRLEGEQLGENYLGLGVGRWKASWGSSSLILQPLLSCRQLQREISWLFEVTGSLTGHLAHIWGHSVITGSP